MWHHASIRGIICNLTYTGVLRSGESRSQTLPHLQIIEQELFEAAQHIRTSRANSAEQERRVPLNTRGQSLLAGNVFCGHCGSRLALTTNGKAYPCKEDAHRIVKRVRYICYGKTRKQTECDGQTGYTAHILDGIIDKVVRPIFERMKAIPKVKSSISVIVKRWKNGRHFSKVQNQTTPRPPPSLIRSGQRSLNLSGAKVLFRRICLVL